MKNQKAKTVDCICKHMKIVGTDMQVPTLASPTYRGLILYETYGTWRLECNNDVQTSVEIFYCPFCGKKLNNWDWAMDRIKENFKGVL